MQLQSQGGGEPDGSDEGGRVRELGTGRDASTEMVPPTETEAESELARSNLAFPVVDAPGLST